MATLDGNRIDIGNRRRITDVPYFGTQSSKVGSWSDEVNIAFPIKTGRLRAIQKPIIAGRVDMVEGNRNSRPRLNYGNPYSSGN